MDQDDIPIGMFCGDINTVGIDDFAVGTIVLDIETREMFVNNGTHWVAVERPESQQPTEDLRTFVTEELTFDERDQMIIDWNAFEQAGSIDDCVLRDVVGRWKSRTGGSPMGDFFGPAKDLMFEVYRIRSETIIERFSS